jgi:hypothetical protein
MGRRPAAISRLDQARAAHADAERRIGKLEDARITALLSDDDAKAARLDVELENQRRLARGFRDKIKLLEVEAEHEAAERRMREHEGLVQRFEKKLNDADAIAVELQADVALVEKKFRKIIALREEARAAFAVRTPHAAAAAGAPDGCALAGGAVKTLLMYELYRVGHRAFLGGHSGAKREVDLPGGLCPKTEWALEPEKIEPFAEALKRGSQFAVELLRADLALPPVSPATNGHSAVEPAPAAAVDAALAPNGGTAATPPASAPAPMNRLAELLARQAALAGDISEQGEKEYQAVVAEISTLQ